MAFLAVSRFQLAFLFLVVHYSFEKCLKNEEKYSCDSLEDWPSDASDITIKIKKPSKLQLFGIIAEKENLKTLRIHSSINKITAGAIKNFKNMTYLQIVNNNLLVIGKNTFENVKLNILDLSNNKIATLEKRAFQKTPRLEEIKLTSNNLTKIFRNTFINPELIFLQLDYNQINTIEDFSFSKMKNLAWLNLNHNRLKMFTIHKILNCTLCPLEMLYLQSNFFTEVTKEMTYGLEKLIILCLGRNYISFIEADAFSQSPRLEVLSLDNNLIATLDANIFPRKGYDNLRQLFIGHNKLSFLEIDFLARINGLTKLWLGGNPWECSCLDSILTWLVTINATYSQCDEDYFNGKRPICVTTKTHVCQYEYNERNYWIFNYHRSFYDKDRCERCTHCDSILETL